MIKRYHSQLAPSLLDVQKTTHNENGLSPYLWIKVQNHHRSWSQDKTQWIRRTQVFSFLRKFTIQTLRCVFISASYSS